MRSAPQPLSCRRVRAGVSSHRLVHLRRQLAAASALLASLTGAGLAVAPAQAAAPALTPSVVGEPPQGAGVFRFPQAVAVTDGGSRVFVGDQYSSIVQAFGATGEPLFRAGRRGTRGEPGRLGVVGGVAVDRSGHLYVLDTENDRVQIFSASDGQYLTSFGDKTQFNLMTTAPSSAGGISAGGITVFQAPGGAPVVYIADNGNDRVARIPLDPQTLQPTGPHQLSNPAIGMQAPQGLSVDATGSRLYVADDVNHRILVLDATTLGLIAQGGAFGKGAGEFQYPYDVAVDNSTPPRLYVADNLGGRVQVFDASTLQFLSTFGFVGYGPGLGNLEIVRAVGALADAPGGKVYVGDTANNRIQVFDAAGNVTAAWGIAGRGPGYVTRPRGVAFRPDGGISVADSFDHRIAGFAPDGTYDGERGRVSALTRFTYPGPETGQFELPQGVAYGSDGSLWVADTGNHRVVRLSPDGQVLATTADGSIRVPRGLAPLPDGAMLATDGTGGHVSRVAPDGSITVARSGLTNPAALALDPSGTAWVADDHAITNVVTGSTIASPGPGVWDRPAGLAFAGDGTLYVAERRPGTPDGARVVRGTPDGAGGYTWDTLATEGDGPSEVIEPAGLAVNAAGTTLLVADAGNNRLLRFDAPGSQPPAMARVTVGINDPLRGTVDSDLPGISCVTDCTQAYGVGRALTVVATPKSGSRFAGWTGDCAGAGTNPSCTLQTSAARSIGARFEAIPEAPVVAPLTLTRFTISPNRLRPARKANRRARVKARKATKGTVRVATSRPTALAVAVLVGKPGRRQGADCRAVTKKNRKAKACTRFVQKAGKLTKPQATARRFTLSTTWNRRQLPPGNYRLSITATAADGTRLAPVTRAFRVVR